MPSTNLDKWDISINVIGGGTGGPMVTSGLVNLPVHVTSVTTMFDNGKASGKYRDKYGILPPSDFQRAILAHHQDERDDTLRKLLGFRFPDDDPRFAAFAGDTPGHILFLACEVLFGRADAVRRFPQIFSNVRGIPLPVSLYDAHLVAVLSDGTEVVGETKIDTRDPSDLRSIEGMRLSPSVPAYARAAEAVARATINVAAPGDFYTSFVPNLLVELIPEALEMSGRVVFPLPLMTKPAETRGYIPLEFVKRLQKYARFERPLEAVIIADDEIPQELRDRYAVEGEEPVVFVESMRSELECCCKRVITAKLLDRASLRQGLIRHDPLALANILWKIAKEVHEEKVGQSDSNGENKISELLQRL